MYWEPEAMAKWEETFGTEAEIEAKKAKIEEEGLTATVHLELSGELWMLVLEPVEGKWTHMRKPEALEEHLADGPYHISILFNTDVTQNWQQTRLNNLKENYEEPFEYTFYVSAWGSGMSADITHDQVWEDLNELHQSGSYYYKQLHVSM